jgi:two-component system chemotaxis response regulator CheB
MPVMDGLVTLKQLRQRGYKMPVIMCSSLTHRGAKVTIEALAGGASDYVAKPSGQADREAALKTLAHDLLPKIHALTVGAHPLPLVPRSLLMPSAPAIPSTAAHAITVPSVVVIGVSTGGPAALDVLLPALPAGFPLPVLIVQHMPEVFTRLLAERLNSRCKLNVREGVEGELVQPGMIYIARGNWHMEIMPAAHRGAASIHLNQNAQENHCRPAADVLFRSAANHYGAAVLAVVLTGMGSDGLIGCRQIRAQGGTVLAQDRATSVVWGMPGAVAHENLAHKILPLAVIGPEIVRLAGRSQNEARILNGMVV